MHLSLGSHFAATTRRRVFVCYSVTASVVLFVGAALSASFFAHFESKYTYTTPVTYRDVWIILTAFRLPDLVESAYDLVLTISVATTLLLVIWRASPWWARLLAGLPQLPIIIMFPFGVLALIYDLPFPRDGEWLHEGWPLIEASAVWAPVTFISVGSGLASALRAARSPSRVPVA